jgi:hypothetical protein
VRRRESAPRRRLGGGRERDALAEVALDLLEHRPEEVLLVGVLMIEGAPRHAGTGDQILGGGSGKAALTEELAGRGQKADWVAFDCSSLRPRGRPACRFRPLPLTHILSVCD